MSDVGLDRADQERRRGGPAPADDRAKRGGLDGVAGGCSGAVQFDEAHAGRIHPRVGIGPAQDVTLRALAGRGERVAAAVVVDRSAADEAVHRVAVREGLAEGLEHDDAAALPPYVAVGAGVERVGAAGRRESAEALGHGEALGQQVEADSARQGQVGLAAAQALAGQVDGDQRGRLRGVDDEAGALEPECVRDAVRDDAAAQAGDGTAVDGPGSEPVGELGVVIPDSAEVDAGPGAPAGGGDDAGVFQGLPGELEGEPLLRVHVDGLARGDAKELRIETIDPVDEAGARRPRARGPRAEPGPARRHVRDRLGAGAQQFPERGRVGGAGQPAGQTDDRDGLRRGQPSRSAVGTRFVGHGGAPSPFHPGFSQGRFAPGLPGGLRSPLRRRPSHREPDSSGFRNGEDLCPEVLPTARDQLRRAGGTQRRRQRDGRAVARFTDEFERAKRYLRPGRRPTLSLAPLSGFPVFAS